MFSSDKLQIGPEIYGTQLLVRTVIRGQIRRAPREAILGCALDLMISPAVLLFLMHL